MAGLLVGMLLLVLSLLFKGCVSLLLRFDIVNSILLSGIIQVFIHKQQWSNWINIGVFLVVFFGSLILQSMNKVIRILMGCLSTILLMVLGYGWTSYDSNMHQFMVVIICLIIGIVLNSIYKKNANNDKELLN